MLYFRWLYGTVIGVLLSGLTTESEPVYIWDYISIWFNSRLFFGCDADGECRISTYSLAGYNVIT